MLTSETYAREKWCPFTRVSLYHRATDANRMVRYGSGEGAEDHQAFLAQTRCLGSDCMAWRWSATLSGFGHCGLAGVPFGDNAGAKAEA